MPIKCDNTSAINLSKNLILHSYAKHINIRHHFLHDHMQKGDITLEFVWTNDQLSDILTKPLCNKRFFNLRRELGMIDVNEIASCVCDVFDMFMLFELFLVFL